MNNPATSASPVEQFGPFENIPTDSIHPVGFFCKKCKHVVRRAGIVCPGVVPRMMFYVCDCGTVAVWEDERQPRDGNHWAQNVKLLQAAGVAVLVFNGNKRTPPSFSGIN